MAAAASIIGCKQIFFMLVIFRGSVFDGLKILVSVRKGRKKGLTVRPDPFCKHYLKTITMKYQSNYISIPFWGFHPLRSFSNIWNFSMRSIM